MPCPPLFTDAFQSVVHILDSDVFLLLIKACLCRSTDEKAQLWSDAILTRVCEDCSRNSMDLIRVFLGFTFSNLSFLRTRTCRQFSILFEIRKIRIRHINSSIKCPNTFSSRHLQRINFSREQNLS